MIALKAHLVGLKHLGSETIIERGSLNVAEGSIVSIVGESGLGKTSLLNYLLGNTPPLADAETEVEYIFRGEKTEIKALKKGRQIGFVGQHEPFFPWGTILQTILKTAQITGLSIKVDEVQQSPLLHDLGLSADLLNRYPHELSFGQKRRMYFFFTLLQRPKLLIADELFVGLDRKNCEQLAGVLARYSRDQKATILVVTHNSQYIAPYTADCYEISERTLTRVH